MQSRDIDRIYYIDTIDAVDGQRAAWRILEIERDEEKRKKEEEERAFPL